MKIKTHIFKASQPGKHVLITGAVHGNETCGTEAMHKLINELEDGTLKLKSGTLTLVPITNKAAYDAGIRFIDQDLNRCIFKHAQPNTNEQHIANALIPLIDKADVYLDIHSMTSKSTPSTFEDNHCPENAKLIQALDVDIIYTGWDKKYKDNKQQSTTSYAHGKNIVAATLECGQHKCERAPHVAYANILNVLSTFGLIDHTPTQTQKAKRIRLHDTVYKAADTAFVKEWANQDTLKKGDLIGTSIDGTEYKSPIDGYIIMPSIQAKPGGEWYYLGVDDL